MTTSGTVSLARTRLPSCTISAPVRPESGAAIVAYCSWTFAFSTAARSASTVALERRGAGPGGVDLFAGRDAALGEILIALGLGLRVRRLRDVAFEVRLRLLQRGFERPAIEREEHLALLTSSPSLKLTAVNCPVICA